MRGIQDRPAAVRRTRKPTRFVWQDSRLLGQKSESRGQNSEGKGFKPSSYFSYFFPHTIHDMLSSRRSPHSHIFPTCRAGFPTIRAEIRNQRTEVRGLSLTHFRIFYISYCMINTPDHLISVLRRHIHNQSASLDCQLLKHDQKHFY